MKSDQENNNNIDLDTILNSLSSNLIIVRSYIIYCFFINIYKEINVRLNQSGNYTSWTLGLGDINITHFDSIRGGITGRVETVTSSAADYVINEPIDLIYEFNSLNNTSNFPIQLVRIFDKRLFEVSFSTSWENENYSLYVNENFNFDSIMWRTNSTVRNAKLIITPQDRNRAPVTITFTAYQK